MSNNSEKRELEYDPLESSVGLYHEAQADGVPYDEDLEPFTRELPKLDYSGS